MDLCKWNIPQDDLTGNMINTSECINQALLFTLVVMYFKIWCRRTAQGYIIFAMYTNVVTVTPIPKPPYATTYNNISTHTL